MEDKYRDWIDANVDDDGFGLCQEYAELMAGEFPELRAVYGYYNIDDRSFPHCWCVDTDGNVIDPTVEQFGTGGQYVQKRNITDIPDQLRKIAHEAAKLIVSEDKAGTVYEAWLVLCIIRNFEKLIARE